MRILVAGQTYAPALNGQSVFMTNLAERLAGLGHQVMVIAPAIGDRGEQYKCNGVIVQTIGSIYLKFLHPNAYVAMPFSPLTQKVYNAFQPEVVHVHDHYPISQDIIRAARRHRIRVIGTNHFMPQNLVPYMPLGKALKPWYEKVMWRWMLMTYNRLDVVTGPSRTAVTMMHSKGLDTPAYPISCGVNLHRFHPLLVDGETVRRQLFERYRLDPQKKTFMFVGRVDDEKRIDLLLRAVRLLDRNDIQLVVAGKGAAFPGLQLLTRELDLEDKVHFTGFISYDDLPAMLNSIDIFVMPSEAELLSIASLEAMACARPVLLARAQALPELVDQGSNGYLFEPGNVKDIAYYMALLADHPENWDRMGAASLKKVQAHNIENTLRSYEKLYCNLLVDSLAQPHVVSRHRQFDQKTRQVITSVRD
ncbi:MAG: glycosyltransferase [Anaerolineae bacterium]|nr:glycosyltransferase [Anaerolineae bacterium]